MASNRLQLVRDILRGIGIDQQSYRQLRKLLEQQRICMIRRDCEALAEVNRTIEQHYDALKAQATQRRDALRMLGLEPDSSGIEQLLNWLPGPQRLAAHALWSELESLVTVCKAYNEKNGELLIQQYEFARAFLGEEPGYIYHR